MVNNPSKLHKNTNWMMFFDGVLWAWYALASGTVLRPSLKIQILLKVGRGGCKATVHITYMHILLFSHTGVINKLSSVLITSATREYNFSAAVTKTLSKFTICAWLKPWLTDRRHVFSFVKNDSYLFRLQFREGMPRMIVHRETIE